MPLTNSKSKKTSSYLYSMTFRPKCGIDLGNICHSALLEFIRSKCVNYVLTAEKFDKHDTSECHFQGALEFDETKPPPRQDNLRRSILTILLKGYSLDDQEKLHSLHIVPHNNRDILFEYCLKESENDDPTGLNLLYKNNNIEKLAYYRHGFCEDISKCVLCMSRVKEETLKSYIEETYCGYCYSVKKLKTKTCSHAIAGGYHLL